MKPRKITEAAIRNWKACNERSKEWRRLNPELARARDKKYREAKPGHHAARQREWREKNLEKSRAYHRDYMKHNRATDTNYQLRRSLASRIGTAIRRGRI